ncbi:MAG: N-6 DNA methylase, partial [Methanosphaera sp.]|nr:N-6 DNA methylase [Methanosphaera sp.]
PYEFSVITPEILGNVYESFLGKKIKIAKNEVKIEIKPELSKSGGIYYTPQYIVEYIVENTLSKYLKNMSVTQARNIKILDPTCGSGSFLLGAYNYLLRWYKEKYSHMKRPPKGVIYTGSKEEKFLTLPEKRRILTEHIYGVDLDTEAVEVTKLSLLLKVLENESQQVLGDNLLPYLGDNIKCGNSLAETHDLTLTDRDNIKQINPFDWKDEFPEVFTKDENSGFDVIIGNPPYILERTNKSAFDGLRNTAYYKSKMDIWHFFGTKALDLVKNKGLISFIAPSNWTTSYGASIFRKKVSQEAKILSFIDFGAYPVFKKNNKNVGTNTMIYLMEKMTTTNNYKTKCSQLLTKDVTIHDVNKFLHIPENTEENNYRSFTAPLTNNTLEEGFRLMEEKVINILNNIDQYNTITLNKNEVRQGIVFPQDYLNKGNAKKLKRDDVGAGIFVLSTKEKDELNLNSKELKIIKPYYTTTELSRYFTKKKNEQWVIYTKKGIKSEIKKYPHIKKHLDRFKTIITSDNKPYGLHRARNENIFLGNKIISLRKCSGRPQFSYVEFDCYVSQTFNIIKSERFNLKTLTGILNSDLIYFWFKMNGKKQGECLQIDQKPLQQVPIKYPDSKIEKELEELVDQLRMLYSELDTALTDDEKRPINQEIKFIENNINTIVYDLYKISEDEIELINSHIK